MTTINALIFLAGSLAVYWLIPSARARRWMVMLLSLGAVCAIGPMFGVYYLLMCAFVYWICRLMSAAAEPSRKPYLITVIALLVANLSFYKIFGARVMYLNSNIFPEWSGPLIENSNIIIPIGLSFVTFRLIHYAVETYREKVPDPGLADFVSYVLFFPTFLAGPVERFPAFHGQAVSGQRIGLGDFNYGLWRIFRGIIRKFMIADTIAVFIMPVLQDPLSFSGWAVLLSIYAAAIWLYMDFGGYCDMAIGVSRLFGFRIIENFNNPFFKSNIALFWRNWHISVYSWIRDYFYLPFFAYKGTRAKMYVGIFLTMLLFMLWHAPTVNFLVAGIYNGIGLVVWRYFQDIRSKNRLLSRISALRGMGVVSTIITFSYVSFGVGIAFGGRGIDFLKGVASSFLSGIF
ncbi:MAG: hypothetical protein GF409_00255 [Candidatus Omnitrophica bacterium]|nr:hypothetical protein [Candidatus Omnitrophota bacterium]